MECEEILEKAKQAQEKGELREAIELYQQATECFDKAGKNEQVAKTFHLLAELYTKKEDYFMAAQTLKDTILRYVFSGNIEAAEEVSKKVKEEEIRNHETFQFALNIMEQRIAAIARGEEFIFEPLTDEEMGSALSQIEEKIEITPADNAVYAILGGKTDNFIPSVERIQLKGQPTAGQLQKLLKTALQKKRSRVKSEIISTVTAKTDGEDFEVSFKTGIEKENSELVAKVSFENTYEASLKDPLLTCYIPASYDVQRIDSKIKPKKETALEGMEASFDLKKFPPKEKININFILGRNISRTLIIGQGKEILVIRTYAPIIKETPTRYKSHFTLLNNTGKSMEGVILEDIIPLEFSIIEISAKDVKPYAKEFGDTVLQWKLSKFEKGNKFEVTYLLEPRKTVRIIEKQLQLKDGRNIGRLIKIIEPLEKQGKFLVNIDFQNSTHTDFEDVKIRDPIPLTQKLVGASIEPKVTTNEKTRCLSWHFGKIMAEQSTEISYMTEGEETPYSEPPAIELKRYQSHEVRKISTEKYQGILRESEMLTKFKKQVT